MKKIKLEKLKLQSFVTDINGTDKKTVMGGLSGWLVCIFETVDLINCANNATIHVEGGKGCGETETDKCRDTFVRTCVM